MTGHERFAQNLPLYAIDALSVSEADAMEVHLETCAACRRELENLRGDLALVALTSEAATPPPRSRQRLLAAIAHESHPVPTRRRMGWWLIPFAASAFLAIFVAVLWRDNYVLRDRLVQLQARIPAQQAEIPLAQDLLALITDPKSVQVDLLAANTKPSPHGRAVYAPRTGALFFMASDLPPAPPHKAYELWLLPKEGTPVPAGTFQPDSNGNATLIMPAIPAGLEAVKFAVTLEPETGPRSPTRPTVLSGTSQ